MSESTGLPLGGHAELVQVSCAPFHSRLTDVARFRLPKITSDSPKLSERTTEAARQLRSRSRGNRDFVR